MSRSRSSVSSAARNAVGQGRVVAGRDQEAAQAVLDHLRRAADGRGHHRHARRERLQHHVRHPFRVRRQRQQIEERQEAVEVAPEAAEDERVGQAGVAGSAAAGLSRQAPSPKTTKPTDGSRRTTRSAARTSTSKPFSGLSRPAAPTIRRGGVAETAEQLRPAQGVEVDKTFPDRRRCKSPASRPGAAPARRAFTAWASDTQTTRSIQRR